MEDGWWLADGEQRSGPLSTEQVRELVRQGSVGTGARIWRQGALAWKPIGDVIEFAQPLDVRALRPAPELENSDGRHEPTFHAVVPSSAEHQSDLSSQDELPSWAQVDPSPPIPSQFQRESGVLADPLAGPWRRLLARCIDIGTLTVPIAVLLSVVLGRLWPAFGLWMANPNSAGALGLLMTPLALLAEALIFGLFGTTIGKLLMGVRVTLLGGARPTYLQYLGRALRVYWSGLALGIPLFALFTMWHQHSRLKANKPATYDEARFQVHASPMGAIRRSVSAFAVLAMVVGAGYANYLVQVDQRKYFAGFDWRNPISTKSVAVPPGWVFTQQINADEDPVFTFSSDAVGIISVFAMEAAGDLTLEQYQRVWTAAMRPRMYLDVRPSPFVFEGRFGLQIHGVMADNATRRVHVTLIKNGDQIWRMVSVGVSGRDPDSNAARELRTALLKTLPDRPERPEKATPSRASGQPI